MASVVWASLPTLWPQPAASAAFGEFDLLVFTQDGVPIWEIRNDVRKSPERGFALLATGAADSFTAAKAAALHEATVLTAAKSGA